MALAPASMFFMFSIQQYTRPLPAAAPTRTWYLDGLSCLERSYSSHYYESCCILPSSNSSSRPFHLQRRQLPMETLSR
jgi:hypothetical protein